MITLTRFSGSVFALNSDLIERVDSTPDTVITLVDGTKYVIAESVGEFIGLVRRYRADVLAEAQRLTELGADAPPVRDHGREHGVGNVVPLHPRER
jgi:flagellar protein FlbD